MNINWMSVKIKNLFEPIPPVFFQRAGEKYLAMMVSLGGKEVYVSLEDEHS